MPEKTLKRYWGYDSFRPLQKEIITSVLEKKDTLGILPTGGGKSITFQVPGLILPGVTIIVSPLISLMKDQVDNLKKRRIQAVYFHSGMSLREKNLARERLFNNKAKFLYISPERLSSDAFLNEIKSLKVNLIVVDEAHCISQWGYDFRPSYLKVKRLRKLYPHTPVLALTASATRDVAKDICKQLEFKVDHQAFRSSIQRDNLSYVARSSEAKLYDILKILNSVPGAAIIYVRSRKKTKEIAEYLVNSGIKASFYHAGLESGVKEERQEKWKNDELRVIVATNAFGMGIDKGDVRVVIHYDMPPSLEEYYQEAGRAGRDGKQAYAVILTSKSDKAVLRRRLTMEFPPKDIVRKIYTRACVFSNLEIGEGYDTTVDFDFFKFCKIFNLDEAVVRPSFRLLEQAGYLEFIEEFENFSRIMVTVDREELYNIKITDPLQNELLSCILRNYPGIFTDYVFVSEKKIAFLSQIDPQRIYETLLDMSKRGIIHYIPRKKTPLLHFLTSMEEERYVTIGKSIYEDRKEIYRRRVEAMIEFGYQENSCKVSMLKKYFGEEYLTDCGHCDSCRRRKAAHRTMSKSDLSQSLNQLFSSGNKGYSEQELKDLFREDIGKVLDILYQLNEEGRVEFKDKKWYLLK